jgi:integrase/recombinase XerD
MKTGDGHRKIGSMSGFVPYVYGQEQMAFLLSEARVDSHRPSRTICPRTFWTILLVLYATGATQAEVLSLRRKDVVFRRRVLALRNSQYRSSREIPIGRSLLCELKQYIKWRRPGSEELLFTNLNGKQLRTFDLRRRFKILCREGGHARNDGCAYCLRLMDIRHTFAVHRIQAWIRENRNLNVLLPALSVYMGSPSLLSSEYYLHLTPERFQKPLSALCPTRTKKHWRDDPKLMGFLANLS